jgi:hypothetical protein
VLGGSSLKVVFRPGIGETLLYKLVRQRGSGFFEAREDRFIPAPRHFRLVATSPEEEEIGGQMVPCFKLYEVVDGARLQIHGREPGEEGLLMATVIGPRGATFSLTDRAIVDKAGLFEVRIPYATDTSPGTSHLQRCEVLFHDLRYTVDRISEEAVATGATVQLDHRF